MLDSSALLPANDSAMLKMISGRSAVRDVTRGCTVLSTTSFLRHVRRLNSCLDLSEYRVDGARERPACAVARFFIVASSGETASAVSR